MSWTVEGYRTPAGRTLVLEFLDGLPKPIEAEAQALIERLAEQGGDLGMPRSKALGSGLFELRGKSGLRIFYVLRSGRRAVLLDGIMKKRDDIPPSVLTRMRRLAREIA